MAPDKDRKAPREEIEVAYYTKELGRALQRKMLKQRLHDFSDSGANAAQHHDDWEPTVREGEPPREDRAG